MHAIAHGGVYGHRKRVCTESWLWEKNPLPHRGIEPASAACRSDALPTESDLTFTGNFIKIKIKLTGLLAIWLLHLSVTTVICVCVYHSLCLTTVTATWLAAVNILWWQRRDVGPCNDVPFTLVCYVGYMRLSHSLRWTNIFKVAVGDSSTLAGNCT